MKTSPSLFRLCLSAIFATLFCVHAFCSDAGAVGPSENTATQPDEYKRISVKEIANQAGVLESKLVETWGTVHATPHATPGDEKTFILRGDEESILIVVKTTLPIPSINDRLWVKGVVKMDHIVHKQTNTQFHIEEKFRSEIGSGGGGQIVDPVRPIVDPPRGWQKWVSENQALAVTLVLVLLLLVVGFTVLMVVLFKRPASYPAGAATSGNVEQFGNGKIVGGQQAAPSQPAPPFQPPEEAEITIKRSGSVIRGLDENTIKYLPGYLEVIGGVGGIGDKLPLCGGNTITLGSDKTGVPKGAAFIRFEDDTRELSRKQMTIHYDDKENVFRCEHHGLNPSYIDGRELRKGDAEILEDQAVILVPPNNQLRFIKGRISG